MQRGALGTVLALALIGTATACAPQDDGRGTADALAAALTKGDVSGLAFTSEPAQVQEELAGILAGADPLKPTVSVSSLSEPEGDQATVTLNYLWDVPDSDQDWTYTSTAGLVRSGNNEVPWQIEWKPSVVEPSLQAGEKLSLDTAEPERGDILDAAGKPIVTERPVRVVGISKKGLTKAQAADSAKALAAVVDIDGADYAAKVKGYGEEAFVDAITLREAAFEDLDQEKLDAIDGFLAVEDTLPLAPTRDFASAVLGTVREATAEDIEKSDGAVVAGETIGASGIQAAFNKVLAGTAGLGFSAVGEAEAEGAEAPRRELFSTDVEAGKDVQLTLEPKMQSAAEKVLQDTESPSSIVALRPSTGEILAAANGPGSEGYNTAFLGQYAPGSTFKIATALGLMRQGLTPDSTVDCEARFTADGRTFENVDGYDPAFQGEITLTEAIAHSCNTAFVSEYEKLSQDQLADAAGALGVGMTADIGLEAFWGGIPREDSEGTAHAASLIGQSRVQTSPLSLAVMMASVEKGELVVPRLVDGYDGEAKPAEGAELTEEEARQLRTMMRAAVTDGYLSNLAALPGDPVVGKTGTAEYGNKDPLQTHSWVIAAQGDLAVAVFVEDGDLGAVTGAPMVEAFLKAVR